MWDGSPAAFSCGDQTKRYLSSSFLSPAWLPAAGPLRPPGHSARLAPASGLLPGGGAPAVGRVPGRLPGFAVAASVGVAGRQAGAGGLRMRPAGTGTSSAPIAARSA